MEGKKIFRGEEVKEPKGQIIIKAIYTDTEITKNYGRNSVLTVSNSEPGAKTFKEKV